MYLLQNDGLMPFSRLVVQLLSVSKRVIGTSCDLSACRREEKLQGNGAKMLGLRMLKKYRSSVKFYKPVFTIRRKQKGKKVSRKEGLFL